MRESAMDFFDENDNSQFNKNVRIRINGQPSRRSAQKTLRIYPRSDYGQSCIFTDVLDGLPYDEFNLLLLRNSGQDYGKAFIGDRLMYELVRNRDVDVQAFHPSIFLINGEYWGIQNIREKHTPNHIKIKYNIRESEETLIKGFKKDGLMDFDMKAGSDKDKIGYNNMINFVINNDMTDDENIKRVETQVDIDNFLYYTAYLVYASNTDSFRNYLIIRRKNTEYSPNGRDGHDGRWRWMCYDLDYGMGYGLRTLKNGSLKDVEGDPLTYNMINHMMQDEERMDIFRELMNNEDVKMRFVKIMLYLLNNHFGPERVKAKINELASNIRPETATHIQRWETITSVEQWKKNVTVLYNFAEERPKYVREHLIKEFELTEKELQNMKEAL